MPLATRALSSWSASVLLLSAPAAAVAQTAPRYTVVDPGAPTLASPTSLNDSGRLAGHYFAPGGQRRAFSCSPGQFTDIGTLGTIAQAAAINDAGLIVGYSVDGQNVQRAFRYQNGVMSALPTLHGGIHAAANDVNASGWIVGMSQVRVAGNEQYDRAALWRNGAVIDLGTFGGEYAEANAVNDAGQVVGWTWRPLPTRHQHAFLWSDATGMLDLGTLGGFTSIATDVNDHSAVVGSSTLPTHQNRPFLWTAQAGMTELPIPPEAFDGHAAAINNAGIIIGSAFDPIECTVEPLLWQNGALLDLNALLTPGSTWTVIAAHAINDQGVIAATARPGANAYRAVLLVPVAVKTPAPATPSGAVTSSAATAAAPR